MLHGPSLPMANRPHELPSDFDGLFVCVRHQAPQEIAEMLRPGLVAFFVGGIDVDLFQPLGGVHQGSQVHVGMAVLSCPDHTLRAACAGEPDIRVGLLHRDHPGVHHSVLIVFPLIPERPRLGPALDNQVVGLFEPSSILRRSDTALEGLNSGAAVKPGDDPPAGIAVQHGDLFGHSYGVVDSDDVAQNSYLDPLGELGNHSGVQINRRLHTPVGCMVLIGHYAVEADLVG